MDDSGISSKRRRLEDSGTDGDGKLNKRNASLLDKDNAMQGTEHCIRPSRPKEIKWNFQQVRPEILQCFQRVVESLKQTGPEGNESCEKAATEPPMNNQTSSDGVKKELPELVKQGTDEKTNSKACLLSADGPVYVVSREVTRESPGNSKDINNGCIVEINNGCIVENQVTSQQNSSEFTIPNSINRDNLRDEIKKIVKERTRHVLAEAEKLQSRVSTLETENRNLKHKVKMLYKAIKGTLTRQKEALSTTVTSSAAQTEPQARATVCRTMGSVPTAASQPEAFCQVETLPADSNKPSSFNSEAVGKKKQLMTDVCGPRSSVDPKKAYEQASSNSVGTDSHSPSSSLNKETVVPSVYLPKYLPTSYQTSYGQEKMTALDESGSYSSVISQPYFMTTTSTNGKITTFKRNYVSVLNQVLEQILPANSTRIQGQAATEPGSNDRQVSPHCTATAVTLTRTSTKCSEGVLSYASSPHKRSLTPSPLNTENKGDEKPSYRCSVSEFLFSTSPEAFKADRESRMPSGNTCHVTAAEEKGMKSIVANSGKPNYKSFADTPFCASEVQPKVVLSSPSAIHFREHEKPKANNKFGKLLGNTCHIVTFGERGTKSIVANSEKPYYKAFTDSSFSYAVIQPKVALSATSTTHFGEPEAVKADRKSRRLLANTSLVTAPGEKGTKLTLANEVKPFYKGKPFSDSEVQPKVAVSSLSATPFSVLSQPTQKDGDDQNALMSSGCPLDINPSTSTRGQSAGLLNGISMIAEAAIAGTNATSHIVCPVQSTTKQIPPFSGRRTPNGRTEENKSDLNRPSISNTVVGKDSEPLQTTSFTSQSHSHPHTAGSLISVPGLEKPYSAYREHTSARLSGSVYDTSTTKIANSAPLHQTSHTVVDKKSDKMFVNGFGLTNDKRSIFNLQRKANNNALAPHNFPNCDSRVGAVSPNKYQMMPHRHASPLEDHNFLSLSRLYKERESRQHRPRQAIIPNIVISKPRYQPYPSIRPKGQEAHLLPVWSSTYNVPQMYVRSSAKPHATPTLEVPLDSDVQSSQKQRSELLEPASCQVGFEAAYARLNSTLNSNSLNLLHPLQRDQSISHIPRFSTASNGPVKQDLCSVQTTMNRVMSLSKSPETSKRGFYPNSQNFAQDNKRTTKESWIYNGASLPSKSSSVTESDKEGYQTTKRSQSNLSSQNHCRAKPQLEMSQPCQLYLNQLRKSAEARTISAGSSIKTKPTHLNSALQPEREIVNGHNSLQQNAQFTFQSSVKQQREGFKDQQKINPQALSTQDNKDNNHALHHQNPRRLIFYHKKFTIPKTNPQQEALHEERSNPVHCETKQILGDPEIRLPSFAPCKPKT